MLVSMSTILVLGATGKTGRRITDHLLAAGHTVRAASRTPADPADGVVPVRFDWNDSDTYDAALEGADAVYVIPPALRLDYAEDAEALFARAVAAGVSHGVMLSARGAEHAPEGAMFRTEEALRAAFPTWAVVRPTWFMQNFTESFFRSGIEQQGVVVAPAGDGLEPFIDADDIAAVAAALLTRPGLAGDVYAVSGPEAITHARAAELLSEAAGSPIAYVDADPAEWERQTTEAGVPAAYSELLGRLFGVIRDGHDAHLSDGVQRALGREPVAFANWAAREARDLRVSAAA